MVAAAKGATTSPEPNGVLPPPQAIHRTAGPTSPNHPDQLTDLLPGIGVALGAGGGLLLGLVIAGASGIALGAAVGAGLGVTVGAASRHIRLRHAPR